MTTSVVERSALAALARREIGNYARHPLFRVGLGLDLVVANLTWVTESDGSSSTFTCIAPAATLGLFGLIVMAGLTRRSDHAAAAAGTVATGETTRTLALAAAIAVPLAAGLLTYLLFLVQYAVDPPAAGTVPFRSANGAITDAWVWAVMFSLTVIASVGGPILGLVVARWIPRRGAPVIATVVVVLGTILLQGNWSSTWHWKMVWPWTYWYGPLTWNGGDSDGQGHWVATPGSPYAWLVYLTALCGLGLCLALLHDKERDRRAAQRGALIAAAVAVVALIASMTLGLEQGIVNPVPGPSF